MMLLGWWTAHTLQHPPAWWCTWDHEGCAELFITTFPLTTPKAQRPWWETLPHLTLASPFSLVRYFSRSPSHKQNNTPRILFLFWSCFLPSASSLLSCLSHAQIWLQALPIYLFYSCLCKRACTHRHACDCASGSRASHKEVNTH